MAADRACYAIVFWAKRRNGAAIREVSSALSDADLAEVAWLLRNCDGLDSLDDAELQRRMYGLAGDAPSPEIF